MVRILTLYKPLIFFLFLFYTTLLWSNEVEESAIEINFSLGAEVINYLEENQQHNLITKINLWNRLHIDYLTKLSNSGDLLSEFWRLQRNYKPNFSEEIIEEFGREYLNEHQPEIFYLFAYFKLKTEKDYTWQSTQELFNTEAKYFSNSEKMIRDLFFAIKRIEPEDNQALQEEVDELISLLDAAKDMLENMLLRDMPSFPLLSTEVDFLLYKEQAENVPDALYDFVENQLDKPFDVSHMMNELDQLYPPESRV